MSEDRPPYTTAGTAPETATAGTREPTSGPWATRGHIIYSPSAKSVIAAVSELRASDYVEYKAPAIFSEDLAEIGANAEFITRACNSHADLLAACEEAYDEARERDEDLDANCWPQVRAAISRAKGETP